MITRKCIICGKPFECYPSDNKVTCSRECMRERMRRAKTAEGRKWSPEARKRLSERGETENLKKGTAAAVESPIAGPFETNCNALIWQLRSPEGRIYTCRNLNLWMRNNKDLLPSSPYLFRSGIMQVKRSYQGKREHPVYSYKGWELLGWAKPED